MSAPFDLTQIDQLLRTTRSVRKRLDLTRPVERSVILECLDLAQQAPTAGNQQNWRYLVVTDQSKRRGLADIYRAVSAGYLSAGRRVESGADQQQRVLSSAAYLADVLDQVPVHVLPLARGVPRGNGLAQNAAFYGSVFPAVWSFMLAARSRGLGTTLTTFTVSASDQVNELLAIPPGWVHVALVPTAYTVGTDFAAAKRPPVEQIVSFEDFGSAGEGA